MATPPTKSAILAIALALAAVAAEIVFSVRMTPAWSPAAPLAFMMAFLAGPLLFLVILAWRRRSHPVRSLVLLVLTLLVAGAGVALLANDYYRFATESPEKRTPHSNPVLLPVYQWGAVVLVWVVLVVGEGREKRLAAAGKV